MTDLLILHANCHFIRCFSQCFLQASVLNLQESLETGEDDTGPSFAGKAATDYFLWFNNKVIVI